MYFSIDGSIRRAAVLAPRVAAFLLLAAACGCGRSAGGAADLPTDAPRRIVLVVIDTLRADHLGAYGGRAATPHIDAFARQGVLFRRAYSHAPVTGPSHVSMFTGLLPVDHKVEGNAQIVADEVETLAERLGAMGFETGAFVSLGVLGSQWGFAQGFDTYDEEFGGQWFRPGTEIRRRAVGWIGATADANAFVWVHFSDPHEPYSSPDEEYPSLEVVLDGQRVGTVEANGYNWTLPVTISPGEHEITFRSSTGRNTAPVVFRSIHETGGNARLSLGSGWEEDEGSAPTWWNVAHLPAVVRVQNPLQQDLQTNLRFFSHEKLSPEEIRERYVQEVEYVDRQFGLLVEGLRAHGWWDDSLIILTSDHGEGLGDHGLVGHIEQLYDTLVHVPLIIAFPRRVEPRAVDAVVRHVDLAATVLDFLGQEERHGRGRSLRPLIESGVDSRRRPAASFTYPPTASAHRSSLVLGTIKLIRNQTAGTEELYDLRADPGELRNLAPFDPRRVEAMRSRLALLLESPSPSGPDAAQPAELDEEERRQLRALGYVN